MADCESCGMPMVTTADHGGGDQSNPWCVHCCHRDGTHMSYAEKVAATTTWLMSSDCAAAGFARATSEREAHARAEAMLLMRPYWKQHGQA